MTFDNDPNRRIDPDRPVRTRYRPLGDNSFGWIPMILAVAAVALLIMLLLPARDDTTPRVTENAPRTETPAQNTTPTTPPANTPQPTTPAPKPQQ